MKTAEHAMEYVDEIGKVAVITQVFSGRYPYRLEGVKNGWRDDELVLARRRGRKSEHLVVWDEGCGDPAKLFDYKKDACDFAKRLYDKRSL